MSLVNRTIRSRRSRLAPQRAVWRGRSLFAWLTWMLGAIVAMTTTARGADEAAKTSDFEHAVEPLLAAKCFTCHGEKKRESGLDLRTLASMLKGGETGPAIVPGKSSESLLLQRVMDGEMPPKKSERLTAEQQTLIKAWIDGGAKTASVASSAKATNSFRDKHWAFQRLARPRVPGQTARKTPTPSSPARSPDDATIRASLQAWYRGDALRVADGGEVLRWPDDSGHRRDLTPTAAQSGADGGAAPTFISKSRVSGRAAVRFADKSGMASAADNPLPVEGDAAYTIILVANLRPPGDQFASGVVFGFGEPAPRENPGKPLAALCELVRGTSQLVHAGGFGHNAALPPGSATSIYDRPCVITIVKRPGPMSQSTEFFLNSIAAGELFAGGGPTGTVAVPHVTHRRDFAMMMGRALPQLGAFRGDIAEVAVYNQALDTAARQSIEAGLIAKYGLEDVEFVVDRASMNPIDAFVDAKLSEKKLTAAPPADRRALIRRAYFDLLGLPPPPERVAAFVADASPRAWENLIDELLQSPQYGERWGRHWLDVARYADTGGYETDIYFKNAWRYRDYVVKSFNDDKPYDRFVQEKIAGDELWPDNLDLDGTYVMSPKKIEHLEAHIGTGFYALGPQIHESNMDAKKLSLERLTDWVDTTGAAFLGITLACARCHDHKFDPISQRDYYGLQAVFAASREVELPLVNGMEIADQKQFYPRLLAVDEARRAFRLFEQSVAGRALSAAEQQQRERLRGAIADAILALPERAGSSPNSPFIGLLEVPTATVLGPERAALIPPVHVLGRGDLARPKEQVTPTLPASLAASTGTPAALPGPVGSRKELAQWLTRPDHPLTARVMVNRLWQWHFGSGLVITSNDFGHMGLPPSNGELLDWLASEFVARGWSVKAMHRVIMTSRTYQRSSAFDATEAARIDPENRLLWRMNRRRLEAEALWDTIHSVAGTLNLKMGGRPVMPPLVAEELTNKSEWVVSADPADHTRRGIYIIVRRNFRFPLFDVFDAPVNAISCGGREASTVAPQALWLLNNRTAFDQSQNLAARIVRDSGKPDATNAPAAWIGRLWRLTLARDPSPDEIKEASALLAALEKSSGNALSANYPKELAEIGPARATALAKLCLTVLNTNEFVYVD